MARPPSLTLAGILFGFLLIVGCSATSECNVGCHGTHLEKAYQEGHTYTYQFRGISVTSVTDAQGDAQLRLEAVAELTVNSNCVHQLRLKDVLVNGAPAPKREIEQHALQFNYHGGHIDTELCAEAADSPSALNIKRAVISLFQRTVSQDSGATTHHETDVFGACPTDFTFKKDGDVLKVMKHRNLGHCTHRENTAHGLMSAKFDETSEVKSTPILNSELSVEQTFNRGILSEANSIETYHFKPFSNGDAGAKTVIETSLMYKGVRRGVSAASVSVPKTLIFEAVRQEARSSAENLEKALKIALDSMSEAVTSVAARRVAELIKVLRHSSRNDIISVYSRFQTGTTYDKASVKRIFFDALIRTGSGEAVEVAIELIKNKEIADIDSLLFYTSLPFLRHANLPSIIAATSLLDVPNLPRIGYLGIGSLIGKYCTDYNCENVPEVNRMLAKFASKIGKPDSHEQEDIVISALKALANAQFLDETTLIKVARISVDGNIKNRIRVTALETLPTKCSMTWKNIIFPIMANLQEDSEVRIKAYLALTACPCPHVATKLKEVLEKETMNQFGSFVTSHLRNLRASTNPDKAVAKHHLGQIIPRIKFPEDFRKFSFNNELSYGITAFGIGSSTESNVIYSQDSFIPRSASINLTAQIFGHTFNFVELTGRAENLDRLIERNLGPRGTFSEQAKQFVIKQLSRSTRSVSLREIEQFRERTKFQNNGPTDALELDLSVKLFGAELAFLNYYGNNDELNVDSIVTKMSDIFKSGIKKTDKFDYHFKNHLQFLDAELSYPTGLGFPLTLGITGTSAVHVKARGTLDLATILKNPKLAAFNIALDPSASIRIAGCLNVAGYGTEAGLKVITTLHTATSSDLSLKILDGRGVDIDFGVPKQKQEVISITSEILLSSAADGNEYVAPQFAKGKEYSDCFDQLVDVMGLRICGKILFPYDNFSALQKKAVFPLSGPAMFTFYFENKDVLHYHFKAHYDYNPTVQSYELLFDTPSSRKNRRLALLIEAISAPERIFRVIFDSPFKKASFEGSLKSNDQEKSIAITIKHDSDDYNFRAGIASSGNKYKPILEYTIPEHVERLGSIRSTKTSRSNGQRYQVGGLIEINNINGGKTFRFNRLVLKESNHQLVSLDGTITIQHPSTKIDLAAEWGGDVLSFQGEISVVDPLNYRAAVIATSTKNPQASFSADLEIKGDEYFSTHNLIIVHGKDLTSRENRITLSGKHNFEFTSILDFNILFERKLKYPALGLDFQIETGISPKSVNYDFDFRYQKFVASSELSVKTGVAKPGDFDGKFEVKLQDKSVELKAKRVIVDARRNKLSGSLEFKPGNKIEVTADVTYDVRPNSVNTEIEATIDVNRKLTNIVTGFQLNADKITSQVEFKFDNVNYIDFVMKIQRDISAPQGTLKLKLKDRVLVEAKYDYRHGNGNGHFTIELPKFSRKITANGDVSISGSRHITTIEVLYDATRDPSKRLKFSSDTDFTETSIHTKNIVEILSYKTIIDANAQMQGKIDNGHIHGDFELTFPNGRYITGRGQRTVTTRDDVLNVQAHFDLADAEQKGGNSQTFVWNVNANDVNSKTSTFYITHDFKIVNFNKKDAKLIVGLKNLVKTPDMKMIGVKFDLSGSQIPAPVIFEISSNFADNYTHGSGTLKTTVGNNFIIKANGNYENENNIHEPVTVKGIIEAELPLDGLRNFKLEGFSSVLIPERAGGRFELSARKKFTYNNDKCFKMDSHFVHMGLPHDEHNIEGSGKVTLEIQNNYPLTIGYSYKHNPLNERKESSGSFNMQYHEKKASISFNGRYRPNLTDLDFDVKVSSSFDKQHNIDVKLHHQDHFETGSVQSLKTDASLSIDQAIYAIDSDLKFGDTLAIQTIVITYPSGKTEVSNKFKKLGNREATDELKVKFPQGFVSIDGHVNLESIDDFIIKVNFDSDRLKQRNIHIEISNKAAKTGRRIVVNVNSDGKTIVMGSTNYKKHSEGNKVTIEGNGSLKVGDDTKASSFKYTKQQLITNLDGESGLATLLNINFGHSGIVGEYKATDKEFHFLSSYCEQSKDCAQFEVQSKWSSSDSIINSRETTVEIDLRKFNVPFEFGLKTNDRVEHFKFDHTATLYLHSAKEKKQYSYRVYGFPVEYGIVLTLPSRELAIISTLTIPRSKPYGNYETDISFYSDRKNAPKERTSLTANADVNYNNKEGLSVSGKTTFTYPKQPKELSLKGELRVAGQNMLTAELDIDVFGKRDQKIVITAKLVNAQIARGYNVTGLLTATSRGQHLRISVDQHLTFSTSNIGFGSFLTYTDQNRKLKSTGILFSFNLQEAHLMVQSPNKQLIRADSMIKLERSLQKIHTEFVVLGTEPTILIFEVKDLESFALLRYLKNDPSTKLEVAGDLIFGKSAQIIGNSYNKGTKQRLFRIKMYLDSKRFFKPDFETDQKNIVAVIEDYRHRVIHILELTNEYVNDVNVEVVTEIQDYSKYLESSQPNLKPLINHYQELLDSLKNELRVENQSAQDLQIKLNSIFGGTLTEMVRVLKQVAQQLSQLQVEYMELTKKILQAIQATIPQIKQACTNVFRDISKIIEAGMDLSLNYVKVLINIIHNHQKEFEEIATVVLQLFNDIAGTMQKIFSQIQNDITIFVTSVIEQVQSLPITNFMKTKYADFRKVKIPENIIRTMTGIVDSIKQILPTKELQDLVTVAYKYTLKHIEHEKVEDLKELSNISNHALSAINSLRKLLLFRVSFDNLFCLSELNIPIDVGVLTNLPGLRTFRSSIIALFRSKELPELIDIYHAYRPSVNFGDILPPFRKFVTFADGGHFFTFDGRYITLFGKCSYVLVQDVRDGNFTIVAELDDSKLTAVTITDPTESITILPTGGILVNNQPAEFPAETMNLRAFLTDPVANVVSKYGVKLTCTRESSLICSVDVSGFYHGRTRGILGNANNEPYDDLTLLSGETTENERELADSYKLRSNCPAERPVDHNSFHRHEAICTEFFTADSPMSACFSYVNPANYRQACDIALTSGAKENACLIAKIYHIQCRQSRIFVDIPHTCGACQVRNQKIEIGDVFSVQFPKQQADIVFVVEQATENTKVFAELIPRLITTIKTELKDHGISDVKLALIGYGDHMEWPQHYTTGGSSYIEGEVKNMKFYDRKPTITLQEVKSGNLKTRFEFLIQELSTELGTFKLTDAYEEALNYPFRPAAARTVVSVIATPCVKSRLPISLQQLRLLLGHKMYRDLGLTYHHISTLDDISIAGKSAKNIVGFDADSVFTFADSKKRVIEGSSSLKNDMVLDSEDVCATFAADSGGAAFSAHNFLEAKSATQQRQFIQVAARRIAKSLITTEYQQDCVCKLQRGIYPRSECKITAQKEKETIAKYNKVKG